MTPNGLSTPDYQRDAAASTTGMRDIIAYGPERPPIGAMMSLALCHRHDHRLEDKRAARAHFAHTAFTVQPRSRTRVNRPSVHSKRSYVHIALDFPS